MLHPVGMYSTSFDLKVHLRALIGSVERANPSVLGLGENASRNGHVTTAYCTFCACTNPSCNSTQCEHGHIALTKPDPVEG